MVERGLSETWVKRRSQPCPDLAGEYLAGNIKAMKQKQDWLTGGTVRPVQLEGSKQDETKAQRSS